MSPPRPTKVLLLLSLVGCPTNSAIPGETATSETSSSETTDDPTDTTGPEPQCGNDVCEAGEAAGCPEDCVDCGNGVVDGSEACDDGEDNSNDYAPTKHCNADCDGFAAHCGDAVCRPGDETPDNCPLDCTAVMCGNGITEAGEQCDDGEDGTPTDSAECDDDCTTPMCGDGNENTAADEQCDDGNLVDNDACRTSCEAAACGDGVVQDGVEACDDGNDVETDDCDSACNVVVHRRVFVTSSEPKGNLGGLSGADTICQTLGGAMNYKAWLSNATTGPADRFDTRFTGVYELTGGELVASGWADLIDGTLEHAIDQTETGMTVPQSIVWSNTTDTGEPLGTADCKNWGSAVVVDKSGFGISDAVDSTWTDFGEVQGCASSSRLYCFEDL